MKNNGLAKAIILMAFAFGYIYVITSQNFMVDDNRAPTVAPAPKKKQKLGSIVRLVKNGQTFCSGTVINNHTILTAAHCVVEDGIFGVIITQDPIEIRADDNVSHNVFVTAFFASSQMDQALLTGNLKLFEERQYMSDPAELTAAKNGPNSTFISCGYPLGGDLYCSHMYYLHTYQFMWAVSGVLLPGMSGGPTMTPDGVVVATNCAVEGANSIVSPIYNIDKALGKAPKK